MLFRSEIITSIFSHPCDASGPWSAGFKVVTLYPGPNGYPELDALKAAVSERTAGIVITNPEDTGIYNPHIAEFTRIVHEAGGLCVYDQANANGILGVARAREAGIQTAHDDMHAADLAGLLVVLRAARPKPGDPIGFVFLVDRKSTRLNSSH